MIKPMRATSSLLPKTSDAESTRFAGRCQISDARAVCLVALTIVALALGARPVLANDLFRQGEAAFLHNRPRDAVTILEQVVVSEPSNGPAFLYLAMSYEQLQMHERAVTTLRRAETIPGVDRSLVRFNLGNNLLRLGRTEQAVDAFTAALDTNPFSARALLNRANARIQIEAYGSAVDDYRSVLEIAPDHPQRAEILRMIALLTDHIEAERLAAEEVERLAAEQERLRVEAEERRLAEEERLRQEAEERRRALLSSVRDSLRTSAGETENLSAGRESIDTLGEEDFDISN